MHRDTDDLGDIQNKTISTDIREKLKVDTARTVEKFKHTEKAGKALQIYCITSEFG
jgi:hypothetical protein